MAGEDRGARGRRCDEQPAGAGDRRCSRARGRDRSNCDPAHRHRPGWSDDAQSDILQALVALGYSDRDAALALKALPKDIGVSDGIKLALKALAK